MWEGARKVRLTFAVIINNSTRNPNHSFSRLTINQNVSLPYQCLLKQPQTFNSRRWSDNQKPACLNLPLRSTLNLGIQLSASDAVQPRQAPGGRSGEFTDCLKTGLCEDAFAVLRVRGDSNLPAGRKARYLKVSVSTELQNQASGFNGRRLVTDARGCRNLTDWFLSRNSDPTSSE